MYSPGLVGLPVSLIAGGSGSLTWVTHSACIPFELSTPPPRSRVHGDLPPPSYTEVADWQPPPPFPGLRTAAAAASASFGPAAHAHVGVATALLLDTTGDGKSDASFADTDGDGVPEKIERL